jgi:hypothetical protein
MGRARFMYDNFITDESMISVTSPTTGIVTSALKDGTGSAVITTSGDYSGSQDLEYVIEIDSVAGGAEVGSATFKWSDDGGSTWDATGVTTSATDITLNNGVNVKWTAGSGDDFVVGDKWYFKGINRFNAGKMVDLNRDSRYRSSGTSTAIVVDLNDSLENNDFETWTAGASAAPDDWTLVNGTIEKDDGTFIGDLLDDDCSSLADWTIEDTGTGQTSQVTFDSRSCFKMDAGPGGSWAQITSKHLGNFGDFATIEVTTYFDSLEATTGGGAFNLRIFENPRIIRFMFFSDGLYYHHPTYGLREVGTNLVQLSTWQTWTIILKKKIVYSTETRLADVWFNGDLVAEDLSFTYSPSGLNGYIRFTNLAANQSAHIDSVRVADGYYPPLSPKTGSYCAKICGNDDNPSYLYQDIHADLGIDAWRGETVSLGAWLWCNTANTACLILDDGITTTMSDYHTGSGEWEWISVNKDIAINATRVRAEIYIPDTAGMFGYVFADSMNCMIAMEAQALVIFDHNLTSSATITLKGNTQNSFTDPVVSETVSFARGQIVHYLSTQAALPFWEISISDATNGDGYVEIGELYLGTYLELSKNFAAGFSEETNFIVETNTSSYGIDRDRFYNTQKIFNIDFNVVPAEDVASMEAMVSAITDRAAGIIKPVWFNKDSDSPEKTWLVKLSSLPVEHVALSFYDMLIEVKEVLRSV